MGKNKIERSQQEMHGFVVGQSNDDITTPENKEINYDKNVPEERNIPNQERSSASNQQRSEEESED